MAYRIVYGPEPSAAGRAKPYRSKLPLLTAGFLLLFLILVRMLWPEGREILTGLLLPGNPETNLAAMETLVSELRSGAGLGQAVSAFCELVLLDVPPV